jgi:acetyl esterase/lipase
MKLPKLIVPVALAAIGLTSVRAQSLNAAQQLALNSLPPALAADAAAARNALAAASLAMPADPTGVMARAEALGQAELTLALARADLLARLQASPNRLNAAQLAQAVQQAAGRGGRGAAGSAGNTVSFAEAPKVLLWPNGTPGALGDAEADKPAMAIYLAPKRPDGQPRPAVVILPGGAYANVSTAGEGTQVAEWLNSMGVSAFVVRYRVSPYRYPAELDDGRRAMQLVRSRAAEFGLDPNRIGLMGFSAGGHLAAYTSTVFEPGRPEAADPVERVSSRPDFTLLIYPVISFRPEVAGTRNLNAYANSGRNLLGDSPSPELVEQLSVETRVTAQNPPTFLYHGSSDTLVAPENSFRFFLALRKAGVPAELHTYESGGHGSGISLGDPLLGTIPDLIKRWLRTRGVVTFEIP